jgi:hypothetical protein
LTIDLELETPLDEAGQACHDPVASRLAADVDVAVVRASHDAQVRDRNDDHLVLRISSEWAAS